MNNEGAAGLSCVEGLPEAHERLTRVLILNRPALEVIRGQDGEETFFYLDPPYLHESRASTDDYDHEMSAIDHQRLLEFLPEIKGKFLLSGYRSALYECFAASEGWHQVRIDSTKNSMGRGGTTKKAACELLICRGTQRINDLPLFAQLDET